MERKSASAISWRYSDKASPRFHDILPTCGELASSLLAARGSGCITKSSSRQMQALPESFAKRSQLLGRRNQCRQTWHVSEKPAVLRREFQLSRGRHCRFRLIRPAAPHAELTRTTQIPHRQAQITLRATLKRALPHSILLSPRLETRLCKARVGSTRFPTLRTGIPR